ncbi:hypothetical protein A2Y99_04025 [Candidatus Gottesmanbacteria bacterium RBG_13_37_7]|uniref:Uncharacterized protein n=1 Tax=Candidatus Gottesmanbacteria bacterium RBG_13_37_7 TaxID=1798369 RepID=A0A1F5YGB4_9BACT|nr:MAG: hypothetical protein A2Y99_04025 [Candidatus Gottesmanbacteria bacterium RBG_13_37_7]
MPSLPEAEKEHPDHIGCTSHARRFFSEARLVTGGIVDLFRPGVFRTYVDIYRLYSKYYHSKASLQDFVLCKSQMHSYQAYLEEKALLPLSAEQMIKRVVIPAFDEAKNRQDIHEEMCGRLNDVCCRWIRQSFGDEVWNKRIWEDRRSQFCATVEAHPQRDILQAIMKNSFDLTEPGCPYSSSRSLAR